MLHALRLARRAAREGEVPVGALVVRKGCVLAEGGNEREKSGSPTAHAEILVIEEAARKVGNWRLEECTLYVTLEPCPMCAGAIVNARIPRVVFGAYDPKAGAMGTLYNLAEGKLNHMPSVEGGVLEQACAAVLQEYFRGRRRAKKEAKRLEAENE